jgi:hypothetical protein
MILARGAVGAMLDDLPVPARHKGVRARRKGLSMAAAAIAPEVLASFGSPWVIERGGEDRRLIRRARTSTRFEAFCQSAGRAAAGY